MASLDKRFRKTLQLALIISLMAGNLDSRVWADVTNTDSSVNISTGSADNSIIGNNNQQATDTGIAVNGQVNNGNLNNNQNSNSSTVVSQPVAVSAPQYNSGSGAGGTAALVLPRNPLSLPNASYGRSNFGLQFGLQNNPTLSSLSGGKMNGLGWFMQGGLTIPFGKIPTVVDRGKYGKLDALRENEMDNQRKVFASPHQSNPGNVQTDVKGKVVGLNAYNYTALSADKLPLQPTSEGIGEIVSPQPKVLALKQADAYTQPLFTGEKVGKVEVGKEYAYLGHTRSGWVKVLLSNGREAWTSTEFEYVKFDYTEVDGLAVASPPEPQQQASRQSIKYSGKTVNNRNPKNGRRRS